MKRILMSIGLAVALLASVGAAPKMRAARPDAVQAKVVESAATQGLFQRSFLDGFRAPIQWPGDPRLLPGGDAFGGRVGSAPSGTDPRCGTPATFIHDIQGSGLVSPEVGNIHTIEGIVVGDFQSTSSDLGGFFVQEEDSDTDGNPLTSEGLFVYDDGFPLDVSPGDLVRATGTVAEYFELTELQSVSEVIFCDTGDIPAPSGVSLPLTAQDDYERYEGMLVQFPQALSVTEVYNLGRYGEVTLSQGGPLSQPTNVVMPGTSANTLQAQNDLRRLLLDDGSTIQNPDPIVYPDPGLSAVNTLRVGDTVTGLTGVMSYGFDSYRLHPTVTPPFVHDNPRPGSPDPVGGTLKVAGFNVLNYFNGPVFPTPRGASSLPEFIRQRDKIFQAILALDADVVGLVELENDGGPMSAIQDLVDGLNALAGAGTFDYVDTGVLGTDEIKVGLIYKPASVTPAGAYLSDPDPVFSRSPLAQAFEQNGSGELFTVIVNHFKSKGCSGATGLDLDQGDGQGCYNHKRTLQAGQLLDFIGKTVVPTSGDPDVLVVGDLNSYAMEDPITALKDGGLIELIDAYLNGAYSYGFEAQRGYLDYGLATGGLASHVSGVTIVHYNADEPRVLDYNEEFKSPGQIVSLYNPDAYRSSDHDPVLVGLDLAAMPPTPTPTQSPTPTQPPTPTETPSPTPSTTPPPSGLEKTYLPIVIRGS